MSHRHLTITEREVIMSETAAGKNITQVARLVGRNKSTVSRELRRNLCGNNYSPSKAQSAYEERRCNCKRELILNDCKILLVVQECLQKHWSPEQIVGREKISISARTIYRAIDNGILDKRYKECLRRKGKAYKYKRNGEETRGKLVDCQPIDIRPPEIAARYRIGDWEGDTVLGTPGTGGIVTLVDMNTRFLVALKVKDKGARTVAEQVLRGLDGLPCHSITFDNGKEFARHKEMAAGLGTQVYFAHPHSPWERGTNENTNGLIREYLPKGTDFRNYTDEDVEAVVKSLNNRPRKVLDYKTPAEAFLQNSVAFGLTN